VQENARMSDVKTGHPGAERLAAFRLGRLSPAERAATEAHLARCAACRRELSELSDAALLGFMCHSVSVDALSGCAAPTRPPVGGAGSSPPGVPAELARHTRYRVLEMLGRGGMGAVYKAQHLLMQRLVALKVIDPGLTGNPAAVERFRREVIAAARLSHPNIVTALDAEQVGDLHFLVMEYVDGQSLADVVARHKRLPVPQACGYIAQAAAGLEHAFRCGMVHRDIKPHNLILTRQGQVKLLDFGLARFLSESPSQGGLTRQGALMGTPDYIAPEQSEDPHKADIRADIYSLGCTLYCLLAGQPPFPGGTLIQKVLAHLERTPEPLQQLRPDVPAALEQEVARMMAKRPEQRYQTPAEVIQALAVYHSPGRTQTPARSPPAPPVKAGPTGPAPTSASVTAGPDWSSLTEGDRPPAAQTALPPRKVLRVFLGAVGLLVTVVVLLAVIALRGPTESKPTPTEAKAPPRPRAPATSARSPQPAWPIEQVQQGKVPAPDMSGLPILFNNNFRESNNGFGVGTEDGKAASSYSDGKLRLTTTAGPGVWWWWPLPHYLPHPSVACEFVGRVVREGAQGWGCLVNGQKGRAVRVSIDSDGALHVLPYDSSRKDWVEDTGPLNRTFRHRAIKPRGEANALLCVVRGRQLELYVNGVAVQNPITFDGDLTPAGIGYSVLGGRDGSEVEFERITVWSVADLPPPEARGVPTK
jgi:serine/threonine protein kinase